MGLFFVSVRPFSLSTEGKGEGFCATLSFASLVESSAASAPRCSSLFYLLACSPSSSTEGEGAGARPSATSRFSIGSYPKRMAATFFLMTSSAIVPGPFNSNKARIASRNSSFCSSSKTPSPSNGKRTESMTWIMPLQAIKSGLMMVPSEPSARMVTFFGDD